MNQLEEKRYSPISFSAIEKQLSKIWPTILISSVIALGGAGITVLIAKLTGNPIWRLAKDPAQVIRFQPYIGMLSNWGVLLWMTTAAICLFAAAIMKRNHAPQPNHRFILASGVLSFILTIDDLFVLHDQVFPRMFHVPENFFYLLYFIVLFSYLVYFIRQILQHEYILFIIAFLLFGISRRVFVVIPYFDQFMTTGDMLKYFGIVFWLAFFYRTASHEVTELLSQTKHDLPA